MRTIQRLNVLLCLLLAGTSIRAALTAGTYYIQNVATGTFLTAGANYGYRGVLREHGLDFKVTGSGKTFTLQTRLNGADYVLKSTDGYLDGSSGTWQITELDDGTYAMYSTSKGYYYGYNPDYTNPYVVRLDKYTDTRYEGTHWRFLTREDLAAALVSADAAHPADATFFITAPDFLTRDHRVLTDKCWGNDLTAIGGETGSASSLLNNANAEKFNTPSWNIKQTITGIPNGTYSLSVQGFYRYGSVSTGAVTAYQNGTSEPLVQLYAGSLSTPLPYVYDQAQASASSGFLRSTDVGYVPDNQAQAAQCFTDGYYVTTLTDIVVTDGTLTLGIRKQNKAVTNDWACFDNFTLLYFGSNLSAIRQTALDQIAAYEALTAGEADDTFAAIIADARNAITEATTEEAIAEAITRVKQAYILHQSAATPTTAAIDLTHLLHNADFAAGTEGWNAAVKNNGSYTQTWNTTTDAKVPVVEAYAGWSNWELASYALTQDITLSPGTYRLRAQAFYRWGQYYNSDTQEQKNRSCASLVAGDNEVLVARLGDVTTPSLRPATYANTTYEGSAAFMAGLYRNELIFTLDAPTTLAIGYRGTHTRDYSWFLGGPLTLEKVSPEVLAAEELARLQATRDDYAELRQRYATIAAQVTAEGLIFDTSEADAALDTATTVEAVRAAADKLGEALGTYMTAADAQFDITSLIQNPDFETGTADGWDVFSAGDVGVHATSSTTYAMEGSEGDYLFNTWHEGDASSYNHFLLQTLRHLPAGSYQLTGMVATNQTDATLRLVANNFSAAVTPVSKSEAVLAQLSFTLKGVTDVRLGIHSNRWFKADDFHLYFGSTTFQQRKAALEQVAAYDAIAAQATDRTAYDTSSAAARSRLEAAQDPAEMKTAVDEILDALKSLISTTPAKRGQWDITPLIANPDFDQALRYWSTTGTTNVSDRIAEAFDVTASYRISQSLSEMPAGTYTLAVQGFYRHGDYATSLPSYLQGREYLRAYLLLGRASQPVRSIYEDTRFATADADVENKPMPDGSAFPNTTATASAAFRRGQYWNTLSTTTDSPSALTVGLRMSNATEHSWLAFDNFRLYYGQPATISLDTLRALPSSTYADVTSSRILRAGQLNAVCLPYEASVSDFKAVYELGSLTADGAVLVPARTMQAARTYFVEVAQDQPLKADGVLLTGVLPDSIPALWDGTFQQGAFAARTVRGAYLLNESGTAFELRAQAQLPACTPAFYPPVEMKAASVRLTTLTDWSAVAFQPQTENAQAHRFLASTTYTAESPSAIVDYNLTPPARRDFPAPVVIPIPSQEKTPRQQNILVSNSSDFTAATQTVSTKPGAVTWWLHNFVPGQTYYYKVEADGQELTRGQFTPAGNLRMIYLRSGSNIRDLGGWTTEDGRRLQYGHIYRGGEMHGGSQTTLTAADVAELKRLGVAAELDLREDADFADGVTTRSALGAGVPYYYFNQQEFGSNALQLYRQQYRHAFDFIAKNLEAGRAVYFHCIWGADRTGAMAFLLEGLCGVRRSDMYQDYELTTFSKAGTRTKDGLDSKFTYIDTFEGTTQQQRFFRYLNEYVGVPADTLNTIRRIMLEPATGIQAPADAFPALSGAPVYDLSGRRIAPLPAGVLPPRRGIYITRGRKIVISE